MLYVLRTDFTCFELNFVVGSNSQAHHDPESGGHSTRYVLKNVRIYYINMLRYYIILCYSIS